MNDLRPYSGRIAHRLIASLYSCCGCSALRRHSLRLLLCLVVLVAAGCDPIVEPNPRILQGRLYVVTGSVPILNIAASTRSETATTVSDPGGRFTIRFSTGYDSVSLRIDGSPLVHNVVVRMGAIAASDLRVLLVPSTWRINGGTFDGITIGIDLQRAFARPCLAFDANCDGFYPTSWLDQPHMWQSYPVPVIIDHFRTDAVISATDSANITAGVENMNTRLGGLLVKPGQVSLAVLQKDSIVRGVIALRADKRIKPYGGFTTWWTDTSGDIAAGVVRSLNSDTLTSPVLLTHELLHALGFKHTCAWKSIMGGYGCLTNPLLTPDDVAYIQLAIAYYKARAIAGGRPQGWRAALDGQRATQRITLMPSFFHSEENQLLR
jgi:hypothetical protein